MPKVTFLGAGSTVFAKSVLGDCMLTPALHEIEIALYDIDAQRLQESLQLLEAINTKFNQGRARIKTYHDVPERRAALHGADFVVNAIQVGGYEPCTVTDFEVPKKYGLRQTIGDTLGIGGIFRGLRTLHVMFDIARDMETVCPDAWMLNYTNPMSIVTGGILKGTAVKIVGLCHSVQVCASGLLRCLGMAEEHKEIQWKIAGINHMGWLLEISDALTGADLYPRIRELAAVKVAEARVTPEKRFGDMVRLEVMRNFGYYVTESSEHMAEYMPYWIKSRYPELIDEFNIPLDEYPRRCITQLAKWAEQAKKLFSDEGINHTRSHEYASYIMEAIVTDIPTRIGGNVLNHGLIPNLPADATVEVACLVDRNGVQGCYAGALPEQCAGLNRACITVHNLTIEAAISKKRDAVYQAAFLDPHTASELTLDQIRSLCDDLIEAHAGWLPEYK